MACLDSLLQCHKINNRFVVTISISLITCHFEELQLNIGNVDLDRLIMSLVTSVIRSRILHPWRILDTNYQEYLEGRISTIKSSRLTIVFCEQTVCNLINTADVVIIQKCRLD